jgi:hypothetical protein
MICDDKKRQFDQTSTPFTVEYPQDETKKSPSTDKPPTTANDDFENEPDAKYGRWRGEGARKLEWKGWQDEEDAESNGEMKLLLEYADG